MLRDLSSASLAYTIQSFAQSKNFRQGKQIHALLIRSGHIRWKFIYNHLLNMYAKCGKIEYARTLFETMSQRNMVSWTAIITALSQNLQCAEAIETFGHMRIAGHIPTQFALSSVIQAAGSTRNVRFGEQVHCLGVKCGFSSELYVGSSLANMYSKCGVIYNACKVFEEMPCKDEVSWTCMIDGYAKNGDFKEAMLAFKDMLYAGVVIDHYVLCATLGACGAMKAHQCGKILHAIVVKSGFERDTFVRNALTDMYSKVGDMESAPEVFGGDNKCMNIVSYSSLIDGYVETNQIEQALSLYLELRRHGIEPNEYTFSSLVKACSNQAALEQGMQLHGHVVKFDLVSDPFVSSTLVDMYGKCGLVEESALLFNFIKSPNITAWNSLVGVFAQHGSRREILQLFDQMISSGVNPNAITFINILIGCSHAGLVKEGLNFFYSMESRYGVLPRMEHYSCVIDLLSRAGKLNEAEEFIRSMPFEPNAFGWCSFLAACRLRGDKLKGEMAAEKLMMLEPDNSGVHVLLSGIYAKEKQWEDVRSLRVMMRDGNLKKLPGYSWVDVGNKTHVFEAEDWCHPQKSEIYEKLDSLASEIKEAGYIPQIDSIPYDMDDNAKEKVLMHHSEKIAIAFALISVPLGKPIIIKKNLRVCVDCHSAVKLISKVTGRKIIVRDHSRFHHFLDGNCSCGDYW